MIRKTSIIGFTELNKDNRVKSKIIDIKHGNLIRYTQKRYDRVIDNLHRRIPSRSEAQKQNRSEHQQPMALEDSILRVSTWQI